MQVARSARHCSTHAWSRLRHASFADLEVLTAFGPARQVGGHRVGLTLPDIGRRSRRVGRRAGLCTRAEGSATFTEQRLGDLTRGVATLEGDHLYLIDAQVALGGAGGMRVLAGLAVDIELVVAGIDGGVEAGRLTAVRPLGATELDTGVVAVQAGVFGGLEVFLAASLAVFVVALGVLDAGVGCLPPAARSAERPTRRAPPSIFSEVMVYLPWGNGTVDPGWSRPWRPLVNGRSGDGDRSTRCWTANNIGSSVAK